MEPSLQLLVILEELRSVPLLGKTPSLGVLRKNSLSVSKLLAYFHPSLFLFNKLMLGRSEGVTDESKGLNSGKVIPLS